MDGFDDGLNRVTGVQLETNKRLTVLEQLNGIEPPSGAPTGQAAQGSPPSPQPQQAPPAGPPASAAPAPATSTAPPGVTPPTPVPQGNQAPPAQAPAASQPSPAGTGAPPAASNTGSSTPASQPTTSAATGPIWATADALTKLKERQIQREGDVDRRIEELETTMTAEHAAMMGIVDNKLTEYAKQTDLDQLRTEVQEGLQRIENMRGNPPPANPQPDPVPDPSGPPADDPFARRTKLVNSYTQTANYMPVVRAGSDPFTRALRYPMGYQGR